MIRTRFIIVILAAVGLLAFFTPGCDELITEVNEIRTAGHPTADFTASPDSGCAPLTVQFADASSGPVVSWIWNFGDDSDLLTADSAKMDSGVFHTYTSTGSYTVTLTVLDSIDGSDQEIKKRCVIVDWSIGDFEPSVDSGCPGLEVSFSPIDYFGISSWLWDFGDGSGSNDSTPTHVYDSIDQFTVTLTVDGECGQTVLTDSNLIEIVPCPSVYFGADPREGCAPLVVMFTDSSVVDSNEVIDLWSWNFGNSASGSNPIESAEYTAPGVYEVTLTARVAGGGSSSFTDTIRVYDETSADFSASPTEGCYLPSRQFQVKFNNQSSGHVDSLVWHFGDGDTLHNDSSPVHAYVSPGRYMVILEAYGCGADTLIRDNYITLADSLDTAVFSLSHDSGTVDTVFTVIDSSPGIIMSRVWVFGDKTNTGTDSVESFQLADTGTYEIKLTIINPCGSAEAVDTVVVTEP